MNLRIILLLFISHLLGDFVFQSKNILKLRVGKTLAENIKGNIIHSFVHFILMITILAFSKYVNVLININYIKLLSVSLVIAITHFFIDQLKSNLIRMKPSLEIDILLFLFDQFIHFIAIIIILVSSINFSVISFYFYTKNMNFTDRVLITIIVFLLGTFSSGIFVKKFIIYINFSKYKILVDKGFFLFGRSMEVNGGVANGGFIIGILERIFIMIVVAIGEPSMIGFALTAKSIVRFSKLDDSSFAEYFLIGTFISFILAIVGGIVISTLKVLPIIK